MPPTLVRTPTDFRRLCDDARARGERVGVVPTMGALHAGHLALVSHAKRHAKLVAVTIFVNPTQFGPGEDLDRYPRDLAGDMAKLAEADVVFAPEATAMYPSGDDTRVRVPTLASHLCGPFRPGHFEGVATVVTKLLALTGPCVAVFGRKDYQQLAIIRRLVTDLFLPTEVLGHPIVREPDGLAMSSRNAYLSKEERARALGLSRGLARAEELWAHGERNAKTLRDAVRDEVSRGATSIDYVEVADPESLTPLPDGALAGGRPLVAIACRIGTTRLLDNRVLGEPDEGA
jgi:pantoate--beta-alanine ligase